MGESFDLALALLLGSAYLVQLVFHYLCV
jgi:hypothetical protein